MSGEGPESIPTSADPKSRRPTKKRALTPVTAQAASVDALFARPDQEIRIPANAGGATTGSKRPPPPEIVSNVQGSSAGAGSGEFHVYKASRRREYERLKDMDDELVKEKQTEVFEKEKLDRDRKDDEKTRKNREKREKMKARKAKKGKGGGGAQQQPQTKSNGAVNGDDKTKKLAPRAGKTTDKESEKQDDGSGAATSEPVGLVIHDDD